MRGRGALCGATQLLARVPRPGPTHAGGLLLQLLQVPRRLLRIALLVRLLVAGRGAGDLARELRERGVLGGRLRVRQPGELLLDRSDLGQHLLPIRPVLAAAGGRGDGAAR